MALNQNNSASITPEENLLEKLDYANSMPIENSVQSGQENAIRDFLKQNSDEELSLESAKKVNNVLRIESSPYSEVKKFIEKIKATCAQS